MAGFSSGFSFGFDAPHVWDDAAFLWDPGDALTASSDLVTLASASGVTEGSIVTHLGRTGRAYSGAVGSRFTPPFTEVSPAGEWTLFVVVRFPSSADLWAITLVNSADSDQYAMIRPGSGAAGQADLRANTSSVRGAGNWASTDPSDLTGNTGFVVLVLTFDASSTTDGVLTGYEDSSTSYGSDTFASSSNANADRLTIGRLERSSPINSTGGEIYAAGVWNRPISTFEIDEILDDPFAYLGIGSTQSISVVIASESESSTEVGAVIDSTTAIGVVTESESASPVDAIFSGFVSVQTVVELESAFIVSPQNEFEVVVVSTVLEEEVAFSTSVVAEGQELFVGWGIPI